MVPSNGANKDLIDIEFDHITLGLEAGLVPMLLYRLSVPYVSSKYKFVLIVFAASAAELIGSFFFSADSNLVTFLCGSS